MRWARSGRERRWFLFHWMGNASAITHPPKARVEGQKAFPRKVLLASAGLRVCVSRGSLDCHHPSLCTHTNPPFI